MIDLSAKKGIFFDVGYTLDKPASGDWMLTIRFNQLAGDKIKSRSDDEIEAAFRKGMTYLEAHHLLKSLDAEIDAMVRLYSILNDELSLGLSAQQILDISRDRTYNMENYVLYEDAVSVLDALSKTHRLGIISDTWPSITMQLTTLGIYKYFSCFTYSCDLGVFKPHERMYSDALEKMGLPAEDTVFIDDSVKNLDGAAAFKITPILIAANPVSDVASPYHKIHALSELLTLL